MTIGCNIWMICLKLNWFFYGLSRMLTFSQLVWTPCYSVWDVFNNFLLIDATDRSKISSDQKRFFIAFSLYPFHFSRTLPLSLSRNTTKLLKLFSAYREKGEGGIFHLFRTFILWIFIFPKDNIYIDMQAGINLEVLRKCAHRTISVERMAFYPLDCC